MEKKLYKSSTDKKICGVIGGLAKYLNIDSTILRIIYVLLSLFVLGCPIIIYIVLALVMPQEPENTDNNNGFDNNYNAQ